MSSLLKSVNKLLANWSNRINKRIAKIRHKEYILLSLVIIGGFLVRLYKIDNPIADWHSWRQADTSSVSRTYVQRGINFLYPRYHDISTIQSGIFNPQGYRFVEFPVYNAAQALLFTTFPFFTLEVWGRLLSIFLSLGSAYIMFLLGRRFVGKYAGVLAALFFAFIPYNVYYSRVILPEPLVVFLALVSVWQFTLFVDRNKSLNLFLFSLLFALAILVKPYIFFYGIPLVYLLLQKHSWKIKSILTKKEYYLTALIVVVPFFLWRMWESNFPEGIPFWKWAFNGNGIRFKPSFWYWIFTERIGKLILGGWGLIPLAFALVKFKKNELFTQIMFLSAILYVTLVANANVLHDYYQVLIVPAISLSLAYGVVAMWQSKELNKYAARTLLLFSLGVMFISGGVQIKEYYKINRPQIVEAGKYIDQHTPKDALVIAPYNGDTAFLYQTNRWGWPYLDRSIEEEIEKGADYFVSVDYDERTRDIMDRYQVVEENKDFVVVKLH